MAEYYTADNYKGWKLIGEPFRNKSGKLATIAERKCERCVNGVFPAGVENGHIKPHPAFGGVCLKCGGTGIERKEIRLYTKAEYDALQRNKERAAAKKEEEMRAGAAKKREDWLAKNGFDAEGYTYIVVGLDTYRIKEELKVQNFKYNDFLRWHGADPGTYADNVEKHHWKDFYSTTAWGDMNPLPDTQKKVDSIIEAARPQSTSEWVGEIGKRLREVPVTLVSVHGFESQYGYSQVVKFEDENQNILTWFTSVEIKIEPGDACLLSGTVKDHKLYKNEKSTILTRCKIA